MKRMLIFLAIGCLVAIQTGCQSGPLMGLSKMQLGNSSRTNLGNQAETSDVELAAYRPQRLPSVPKQVNQNPEYENRLVTRPLGYRRGYQACNT